MIGLLQGQTGKSEVRDCKQKIVEPCFRFRGRLALYNGGSPLWIWHVGTKHKYWVVNDDIDESKLDWEHYYWGEFEACPVTKFRKGSAQGICTKAVGTLKATKRED